MSQDLKQKLIRPGSEEQFEFSGPMSQQNQFHQNINSTIDQISQQSDIRRVGSFSEKSNAFSPSQKHETIGNVSPQVRYKLNCGYRGKDSEDEDPKDVKVTSQKCWPTTKFFCRYQCRDLKRRKCHFCLAFCSTFFIVLSTLVVTSIISKGPVVFLKLCQTDYGEIDAYVTPAGIADIYPYYTQTFLNYTAIENTVGKTTFNISPRKIFTAATMWNISGSTTPSTSPTQELQQPRSLQEEITTDQNQEFLKQYLSNHTLKEPVNHNFPSREEMYEIGDEYSRKHYLKQQQYTYVNIILLRTDREREINIGTEYTYDALGPGECIVSSAQEENGIKTGTMTSVILFTYYFYQDIITKYNIYAEANGKTQILNTQYYQTTFPCKIVNTMPTSLGKFGDSSSNVIMEFDHFLPYISDYLPYDLNQYTDFREYLKTEYLVSLAEFSDQLVLTLPSPRTDWYESSDFDEIQKGVVGYVNKFVQAVGFYPITVSMYILESMSTYNIAILLFNLVFDIVLLVFIVISILLIYSLLMIGVETKTLETGIMRMVGVTKGGMIHMVLIQAVMFVLPSIITGFILCFPLLAVIYIKVFKEKLENGFEPIPQLLAVVYALLVGIFIPLISSIIPITRVLSQNLNDALNYQRSRVKAIYIKILKKSQANVIPYIIFGLITFIYGFSIYYMLPLSLLSFDLGKILAIFFFILLGLLFGLTLFAVNAQRFLETVLTYVLFFWEKPSMKLMILNNLKSHMLRNKLTSLIFSMSLAFIIFMLVQYKLIMMQNTQSRLQKRGSFPYIETTTDGNFKPSDFDAALQSLSSSIESFSWISFEVIRIGAASVSKAEVSDVAKMYSYPMGVFGCTPYIFDTTGTEFIEIYYDNSGLSLGEQLYTTKGSQGSGLGTYVTQYSGADPNQEGSEKSVLLNVYTTLNENKYYRVRPTTIYNLSPFFGFTDRKQTQGKRDTMILSLPMLAKYGNLPSVREISYERLVLKLYDDSSANQKYVVNQIKKLAPTASQQINFMTSDDATLEQVDEIVSLIFDIIILITMFLCFFSLSSAVTANLYEQAKEIGILRAIGFKQWRIIALYSYEAFILVMASSMLGIIVGTLAAFSMVLQFTTFVGMPTIFYFPGWQLVVIFIMSIICSLVSTIGPTRQIVKVRIASILKMT